MLRAGQVSSSPVEVLRAADGHQAVGVGEFGEAAHLVVLLEGGSDRHDAPTRRVHSELRASGHRKTRFSNGPGSLTVTDPAGFSFKHELWWRVWVRQGLLHHFLPARGHFRLRVSAMT